MKDPLFQPFTFKNGVTLRNRVVMAPMTTWSSNADETISDEELRYYRARAQGVGLLLTGCSHVQPSGIGFTDEFAAYDDRFIPSLTKLADAAKSGGAVAVLQLFHAGNKAVPDLIPNGELVSASALAAPKGPFNDGKLASRELTEAEIFELIHDFGQATRRAIEAGFDGIELHGAHGFLIQNFLSPLFNQRQDQWGGSLENRMRFPLEVVREVRRVIDEHASRPFLLGYRISPEEPGEGALRIDDALALAETLAQAGDIDYLHTSLYNILAGQSQDDTSGKTTAQRFIERVADRVPLMAAGEVRTPNQARNVLETGMPLVVVGRSLVMNPTWVEMAQDGRDQEIRAALDLSHSADDLQVPTKLWNIIKSTPGWFPVQS
ncbi:NADH-dependent flavin oxidoreductase [Vibrio fluvialis]|uniref:NADH-dependent flavin oxidoreductase n=1 Tax=Vibrio fluvialis TaxID=676 RepID=UPI00192AAF04|nr:NADH-dependent flavin oxidoreductase [Vibrio fluvialis]MBL4239668.1 NADH-dependent flavin oxidoreductase [Vibrio fluvialis]MBL4263990.1 NADH-dependent flavin oxidoreductase [Vibrio fluvialis]MBL4269022.1 NADH-dependent flavin oxidoreductase [Vibrio fluvialis]MBL4273332.1 NADH-dependent flavin oxidoreductase [Vibrio fluvialis]MBO1438845.1 NADH-dependent flavin oxidoreductase [Vibrio fluvialis]